MPTITQPEPHRLRNPNQLRRRERYRQNPAPKGVKNWTPIRGRLIAANASEAVEALQSKFAVDLVFTDINLSEGMNGLELAEWIFSNRPGVRVVVTTGGGPRTEIPRTIEPLLPKPYTGMDLLYCIKRAPEQ